MQAFALSGDGRLVAVERDRFYAPASLAQLRAALVSLAEAGPFAPPAVRERLGISRKFLIPLYQELVATEKGRTIAEGIYAAARPNYHSVSVRTIDAMLGWEGRQGSITL